MRAVVAIGFLVILSATATGLSARPLAAQLSWHEGFGVGKVALDGPTWALQLPIQPDLNAPQAAVFLLEAAEVRLDAAYHDYVGSPQGLVQKDTSLQHETKTLRDARLTLDAIGAEAGFLLGQATGPAPTLHLKAASVVAKAQEAIRLELFPSIDGAPSQDFQRTAGLPSTGLHVGAEGPQEAFVIRGDFTIHLWDIDLRDGDGTSFRSGTERTNAVGVTEVTPNGAEYDARRQVLDITVTDGRLSLTIPGRLLHAHLNPAQSVGHSAGSWDLTAARGDILYGGSSHEVENTDVHIEGTFDATFDAGPDGSIRTSWTGTAETAGAARETFAPELSKATAPSAFRGLWPLIGVIGLALAGGTGGVWAFRHTRAGPAAPAAAVPSPLPVPTATDASPEEELMSRSISLLKDGRAIEVIDALEPGYDAEEPVAAIKAYLLSLAHLKQGEREVGLQWMLRAVHLYPEFGQEIMVNEGFASIREDPRLRRFNDQGATGYV